VMCAPSSARASTGVISGGRGTNAIPFDGILHFRKERARRLAMINRILARIGASCEDWDGEAVAIYVPSGRFQLAATLNDIWPAAEGLTGRRIDPLSLDFLPPSRSFSAEAA